MNRLLRATSLLGLWDRIRARLGLLALPEEIPEDAVLVLEREAEAFLRAGGAPTLREWAGLSIHERAALVVAGTRLQADRAAAVGFASASPMHALQMHGVLDGGAMARDVGTRVELERHLGEIATRIAKTPVPR